MKINLAQNEKIGISIAFIIISISTFIKTKSLYL